MNIENLQSLIDYFSPAILALVGVWVGFIKLKTQMKADQDNIIKLFSLQKKNQDAKDTLPILLEILDDLTILQQGFVYRGVYCPVLWHKCLILSRYDVDADGKGIMSYSQRGHQFLLIGLRIIKNCRKIVYLTEKKSLPGTVKICKEIKECLNFQESGMKTNLEFMINNLISFMARNDSAILSEENKHCDQFQRKLEGLYLKLDLQIENELPHFVE